MNNFVQNLDLEAKGLWFPVVVGIVALFSIVLMPKRNINWRGIYLTFGVVGYVALLLDIIVVGQYFDVFDLGNQTKEGIGDVMTYAVIGSIP
jgi:hypothetical protein